MPYILGTAGHVDHGKTALVKKLTGIETSRLPEEKKRGMTIELGFAALNDPVYGTVGIVDVPGHERFIRNMTAGTWGLDAAMLIVAADDGWMQMTSDHLCVLKAMKIDAILLVITKADLADAEMLELIIDDANSRCEKILGRRLPYAAVSSLTGSGIENLKNEITKLLGSVKKTSADKSFLYIDRAFILKGIGTTITGTLRGYKLCTGDTVKIYPGGEECRIKSIQNHHQDVNEIQAGSRAALNLKVPEKIKIERGMLLTKGAGSPILQGKELLIRIDEIFHNKGEEESLKNHVEIEIALGSTHSIGSLHLNQYDRTLGRLSLDNQIACGWNQNAVLIRHGGSDILAACRILAAFPQYKRAVFKEAFQVYNKKELPSWQSYQFNVEGFISCTEAAREELTANPDEIILCGSWWFSAVKLKQWEEAILKTAEANKIGITIDEVSIPLPTKVKASIFNKLCTEGRLQAENHIFKSKDSGGYVISKTGGQILELAEKAGTLGLETDKITLPQAKKEIRELVKVGKLVCLEGFLHYHEDVFKKVSDSILTGRKPGDRISVADARAASGLSRKYVLPVFNLMEKAGLVKRDENDRIVL